MCSDQPPLRLCKTERVDKLERKRVAGGRCCGGCGGGVQKGLGAGGLFVKTLAVCLLQAKNTTLLGLQQPLEEWGVTLVCLSAHTQQLEDRGLGEGPCSAAGA